MSIDNDGLLALICRGNTLEALADAAGATDGGARLAINRAMYGPTTAEGQALIQREEANHRDALGSADDAERALMLYNLGCFALAQDDVLEARLRFSEVLELQPDHPMARHNLAYAHELLAETEDARAQYNAVLAQNPDCALSCLNLAQLDLAEGDYEQGLAALEGLHVEQPENMGLLLYLCRGLLMRATSEDLERVVALTAAGDAGRYLDLSECRAYALYLLGDLEQAEAAFRQLLEDGADNAFALAGIVKVLGQRGDFKAALPYVERYAAQNPSEAAAALLAELQQDQPA